MTTYARMETKLPAVLISHYKEVSAHLHASGIRWVEGQNAWGRCYTRSLFVVLFNYFVLPPDRAVVVQVIFLPSCSVTASVV
jgi:hypothetical protein